MIVLSFESTPDEVLEDVASTLVLAGARIDALVELSSNFDMSTAERRQQVSLALGLGGAGEDLQSQAATRFGEGLSAKPNDMLQRLVDSDLAKQRESGGVAAKSLAGLPAENTIFVMLPGQPNKALDDGFVLPVLKSITSAGSVVAVAEGGAKPALIAKLRGQGDIKLVTVDGVESPAGQTALALGIRAAIAGTFGHYGFGDSATAVLPPQG